MPHVVNYSLQRGLPFERVISVKNRRTHNRIAITDPSAFIKLSTTHKKQITAEVLPEGTIKLSLQKDETIDLPAGTYDYDVWANCYGAGNVITYQPVSSGRIEVVSYDNVTPLEDTDFMEIRYKQRTDYRRTFTWKDSEGVVITVTDAFMQAKNSSGTTVLDLRWYSSTPSEATVIALTPANKRGYLAPASGGTLELHISDKNDIAVGTYSFDLFVNVLGYTKNPNPNFNITTEYKN
ncbi:MAG: hypothetical protein EBU33_06245, partial [Sphingobacteriia bacterium]|nr:hypothetical protein [Sphingobacteriia bacterium]